MPATDPGREAPFPAGPPAASYSRFSSELQQESSLADQRRECRRRAERDGFRIPAELEFSDAAVSGTKARRRGLDALLAAARAGLFRTLYLFSLSRLARESVITMPLLKDLVSNLGVRVVCVQDGIDTADPNWIMSAGMLAIFHERHIQDLAAFVRSGQLGNVLGGRFSVGDGCFGYRSVPVPGSKRGRRGRNPKPRYEHAIDDAEADWVRRIFSWFLDDKRSISWIARELTRLRAPKDRRSTTAAWHPQYVRRVLANRKYVGEWAWGRKRNRRNPLTGAVRQEERPREERKDWVRLLPHLRIIEDDRFRAAQDRLARPAEGEGRRDRLGRLRGSRPGDPGRAPRHLLAGLLVCGACGGRLHTAGPRARYLRCSGRLRGTCGEGRMVRRDRAARLVLDAVGRRILGDPAWLAEVAGLVRAACRELDRTVPEGLKVAAAELADVEARIARLLDRIEEGAADPDVSARLAERRATRDRLNGRLAELERLRDRRGPEPDEAWVRSRLEGLGSVLGAGTPAAALALRDLVGGAITVTWTAGPDGVAFPRLTFRIEPAAGAAAVRGVGSSEIPDTAAGGAEGRVGGPPAGASDEVVADLRDIPAAEALADRAKALFDAGRKVRDIGAELGCGRALATKALEHWHLSRGLEMPDFRSLRGRLPGRSKAAELADAVKAAWDAGDGMGTIAATLGCSPDTVTAALRHWHVSRGLPPPDGRSRNRGRGAAPPGRRDARTGSVTPAA